MVAQNTYYELDDISIIILYLGIEMEQPSGPSAIANIMSLLENV